jgi:predicted transcriptional regulator
MATISCKIPEKLDAELEVIARRRRVSKSTIVREALEQRLKRSRKAGAPTVYDLAKSVCGKLTGPSDLATNPKYMDDFGA